MRRHIPVEIGICIGDKLLTQTGLAHLARPAEKHHLAGEVVLNTWLQVARIA